MAERVLEDPAVIQEALANRKNRLRKLQGNKRQENDGDRQELSADIRVLRSQCAGCTAFRVFVKKNHFPDGTSHSTYDLQCRESQPMHQIAEDAIFNNFNCREFSHQKNQTKALLQDKPSKKR